MESQTLKKNRKNDSRNDLCKKQNNEQNPLRINFCFETGEDGQQTIKDVRLSDGTTSKDSRFLEKSCSALKQTTGTENLVAAFRIIEHCASGMPSRDKAARFNDVTSLLPSLKPKNELEAMLLGQFLALQQSGMKCLRAANDGEMFCQIEKLFPMAVKLFRCANETISALFRQRNDGKQMVIANVSGGQAIVANEVSSS
jgi:hypothetical protein